MIWLELFKHVYLLNIKARSTKKQKAIPWFDRWLQVILWNIFLIVLTSKTTKKNNNPAVGCFPKRDITRLLNLRRHEASALYLQTPFTARGLLPEEHTFRLKPKGFFHQPATLLVFPRCTSWSTVLPHTNSPACWIRASLTSNICFPRWFCYCNSLAQKLGQGYGQARFPASPQCLHSLIRPCKHVCRPAISQLSY